MTLRPSGIVPALITPLTIERELDLEGLDRLVAHVLDAGVHGVLVLGGQGEGWAFDDAQRAAVIERAVAATGGRAPVYVGVAATTTTAALADVDKAARHGADAAVALPPVLMRPTQSELIAHFRALAGGPLPVVIYNHPARAQATVSAQTLGALAGEPGIVGIKDSGGDLAQMLEYLEVAESRVAVLVGHDALIAAALAMGAEGAVTSCGGVVPALLVEMYDAVRTGDMAAARTLQLRLLPLRRAFDLGTMPIVLKEAAALLGICGPTARSPVERLDEEAMHHLRRALAVAGTRPRGAASDAPRRTRPV